MEYNSKEAEKQFKDLRSRFLGMMIGCAVGEIVARESLVYVNPQDEQYERQIAEESGEKPRDVLQHEPGKNTELLNEACEVSFCTSQATEFQNCWPSQLFFRVAPAAFISVASNMSVHKTVSMAVRDLKKTDTEAFALLPPIESVLLLRSVLQKKTSIYETRTLLEATIKTNPDTECLWPEKSLNAYWERHKGWFKKLNPGSGLYMVRFVLEKVLRLKGNDDWGEMPPWKVATDRLIQESSDLENRDRLIAGALTGVFLGAHWGIGTINTFYRNRLADLDGYFKRGQWWADILGELLNEAHPENRVPERHFRDSPHFRPYLAHKHQQELKTVFYTVVVRNDVLGKRYPGGVAAYHHKHSPIANRDICISCHMGGDVDDCIDDLLLCGLMPPDEFICFDATAGIMFTTAEEIEGKSRDLGVPWLKGRYHDGYLWVRYDGGRRARRRFLG